MNNNNNNNNNSVDNSDDDELDALINGKSKVTDQEPENILTPPPLYTDTNKLPIKEALDNLASPALRLAAYVVDTIYFLFLVMIPTYIFAFIAIIGALSESSSASTDFSIWYLLLIIFPLLYLIFQFLAFKKGTTLGHKYFKLYIISDESGELAKFWRVFLREVAAKNLLYAIPVIGTLYFFIDNFFIFSYEKKTLHDRIVETSVIKLPGSNKRNIIVLSIILVFAALIFIAGLLSPLLLNNFESVKNESRKEMSYQEAIAFTKEINAVAAFTAANDAKEQAIEVAQNLYTGSYSSGIFTSSVGISYQINFDGDTATLGDIFEGEIPVANNQLTTPESNTYIDNKQLPDNVSLQSYQEATAFIKTVNALAAFTFEYDAIEQAVVAIEDFSLASYSSGIFTSSDGTSYQIDFVGDTASLGKSYPKSN